MLTSDVNLVDLHFAVQYQFTDPVKKLFQVREPEQTLSDVSESAIREIVGRSTLDDVQVGTTRPEITRRAKELIQKTLDSYNSGITITTVNLEDVSVPEAVIPSRSDANKAQADKERFILESEAYANGILPVAQGTAARMQQDAQAYKAQVVAIAQGQAARFSQLEGAYAQAPEVTRRRMYMDTIENVLQRAHKVLIDGKSGGNMIYLPIDKLLEKSNAQGGEAQVEHGAGGERGAQGAAGAGHRGSPRPGGALMGTRWIAGIIGAVVAVWLAGLCMFTVNATDYAIVGEFGKIIGSGYTAGPALQAAPGTRSRASTTACCRSPIRARPSSPTTAAA